MGRFATDHFLTKVASRTLVVRVWDYATQLTAHSRPFPAQKSEFRAMQIALPPKAL